MNKQELIKFIKSHGFQAEPVDAGIMILEPGWEWELVEATLESIQTWLGY